MKLVLALALLAAPGLAFGQVYKCVDKNGRTTYTQTKPKDANCDGVNAPTAPATAEGNADSLKKFGEEIDKSRAEEAKGRQQAEQQQAQKAARCAQARNRLAALEQASKVFTVDEQGERHYQSTEQNDQMRADARQSVAAECG